MEDVGSRPVAVRHGVDSADVMPIRIPKRLRRIVGARQLQVVVLTVASCLVVLAILVVVVKVSSDWLAATDGIMDRAEKAEEIARARTVVLALLAGGLASVGAYYTHRNFGLNRQGQITERFTRAVDQLGNENRDVRLGGIYALERLARESQADHGPIIEILTAYVREHAPMIPDDVEQQLINHAPDVYPEAPAADVQAALTVLGRRNTVFDPASPWRLDLAGVYLPRANLRYADLRGADLSYAVLELSDLRCASLEGAQLAGARLFKSDLSGAHLVQVDLRGAQLGQARMQSARLGEAKMIGSQLDRAQLEGAFLQDTDLMEASLKRTNLMDANLEGATLMGADLEGALLSRTNLNGAELSGAALRDARYSQGTVWPAGFDVSASEAVRVKGSEV